MESEPLSFIFLNAFLINNFVLALFLGICPFLGVSQKLEMAFPMGLATMFVLVMSNTVVSLLRNFIPRQVRIATYILVIASFVTVVDYLIQAVSLELHKALGAFISLIVVNCLILGRQEAFASRNSTSYALVDAAGMSIGFTIALLMLGGVREVLGSGSLFGVNLFGPSFEPWVIMILPPGGFLMLGLLLLLFAVIKEQREKLGAKMASEEATHG